MKLILNVKSKPKKFNSRAAVDAYIGKLGSVTLSSRLGFVRTWSGKVHLYNIQKTRSTKVRGDDGKYKVVKNSQWVVRVYTFNEDFLNNVLNHNKQYLQQHRTHFNISSKKW